ncbi:hypothetical protein Dimus_036609, partial [Dionaea muscipula]
MDRVYDPERDSLRDSCLVAPTSCLAMEQRATHRAAQHTRPPEISARKKGRWKQRFSGRQHSRDKRFLRFRIK